MQSKIWFINIVLAVLIVIFGIRVYEVWFAPEKKGVTPKSAQTSSAPPAVRLLPKIVLPQASYQIIAEKTIFSPDRAEHVGKESDASSSPQKTPAKFNLWGVMMLSDADKRALVSEVAANSKKRWVKEGDTLDDRKVSSVRKDRIILSGKDDQQEILLYDSAKLVRRELLKKDQEPVVIAGLGDTQAKAIPKEEKATEAAIVPQKTEAQASDKKVSESPKEKSKQPETPKAQAHPPTPPPASDVVNPFLNLLKGIK